MTCSLAVSAPCRQTPELNILFLKTTELSEFVQ